MFLTLMIGWMAIFTVYGKEEGVIFEYDGAEIQDGILKDKSGRGNDGTLNGVKWIEEGGKGGLAFNGSDSFVEVKNFASSQTSDEFTVEITVKPGDNPKKKGMGNYRLLIGAGGEWWSGQSAWALYLLENNRALVGCVRYGEKTGKEENEVYTVSCPLSHPDAFQKITLVKSRDKLKLFVDSFLTGSVDAPKKMISVTQPLSIGGMPSRFFNGVIREVKVHNCAKEIKEFSYKPKKMREVPYLLMVTSMDEVISGTALLDVKRETIALFDNAPYDGMAFNLVDIYSAQPLADEETVMAKARELKSATKKDIWPRVNLNRIYQRLPKCHYYADKWKMEDAAQMPKQGVVEVNDIRKRSTPYFSRIKGVDVYDEAGALSDFYGIWRLSAKFSKAMGSGIWFDMEDYHGGVAYHVNKVAEAQGKTEAEIIEALKNIGAKLADIAEEEHPGMPVITAFTYLGNTNFNSRRCYASPAYVTQGMLERAKAKDYSLRVYDGGEIEIGYVNRQIEALRIKISKRWLFYLAWLEKFPKNFGLTGTITLWNDAAKVSAWTKKAAGDPNPFQTLNDFKPFLKELYAHYDYIWLYQPMCIDYKPFDPDIAPKFHEKLRPLIDGVKGGN
ncbi:MAG: hypothetical protein PHV34_22060 [Verrucomicrobiae bacterium]|nr:hypothetical protein [Verrucomicrobiae bacterium]